ncbi:MAG: thioredoxin [Longispora sp.]|nr:thioredoxin [Longispora sp. (in: high G+C Gram-positive bacteria)]
MRDVTDASFVEEVLQSKKPVLVDFWAEWCGPCKKVHPLLEELSKELGNKIDFVKVDTDSNTETARAYQIMSIPTLTIFVDGKPAASLIGARPKRDIAKFIEENTSISV